MSRRMSFLAGVGLLAVLGLLLPLAERTAAAENSPPVQAEAPLGHPSGGHEGGEEGATNPLEPQPALAFWTLIVFLGLLFVLGRFAWKPLLRALHDREAHIEHCLLQTEKARNESEQLLAEHRRLMAQADERVRAIIAEAQRDARAAADELLRTAQAEAEAARLRAHREITTARDQALAEIWAQTANLAVTVAGRVLARELTPEEQRRLLDQATRELPAARAGSNGQGGSPA
jgi:F-type H+-transporting ATPase subunit b